MSEKNQSACSGLVQYVALEGHQSASKPQRSDFEPVSSCYKAQSCVKSLQQSSTWAPTKSPPLWRRRHTKEPPAGFLFLCPLEDFKTSPSSFHWPDSPAFWSLDPSGADWLTLKEATQLGFPAFRTLSGTWGIHFIDWCPKVIPPLPVAQNITLCMTEEFSQRTKQKKIGMQMTSQTTRRHPFDSDAEVSEQNDWDVDNESNHPQTLDDSDAEAYSEEDDDKSGSTDFSFHHAPRNSNRVNHDHQGKQIIFMFVSSS
ncbi:hypothetical protein B0H14DRAFT_2600183 [Mycena olivaceomarginata]|nr:hypothetical protein B0H14DRAFT_2600183 [Mycena olivaceomarginata]